MIRMQGNTAEAIRWSISYSEDDIAMTDYAVYEDERDAILQRLTERGIEPIVETLDVSDILWIEGLTFATMEQAQAALAAGREAYSPGDYDASLLAAQTSRAMALFADSLALPDEQAMEIADLYDRWEPNQRYLVGKTLRRGVNADGESQLYRVVIEHTSQLDWAPERASNLFATVGFTEDGMPLWTQPLRYEDAYEIGDRVSHKDTLWQCAEGNAVGEHGLRNTYEPGVWGWAEVTT